MANVSEDIQMVFDAVSQTQNKTKKISDKSSVVTFNDFDEVNSYLKMLPI